MLSEAPDTVPLPRYATSRYSDSFKLLSTRRSWFSAKKFWSFSFDTTCSELVPIQAPRLWSGDTLTLSPPDHFDGTSPDASTGAVREAISRSSDSPTAAWTAIDETSAVVPQSGGADFSSEPEPVLQEFLRVHGFRWYHLILFAVSVLSYLADVISDAYLTITYFKQGDFVWSFLTVSLMILPALVMTSFSLAWYLLDKRASVDPPRSTKAWIIRLVLHALQLAPIVRLTDAVLYGIASRRPGISLTQAVHLTRLMLYEDADSCMLRLIECFMESAPQLLLQLYILLSQPAPDGVVRLIAQYASCGTSWLSLAWCLTAYQSALRNSRVEKANLRCLSTIFYFLWKAGVLLSRLLALALLADAFRAVWFSACLGVHWVVAVACLIHAGTTFCSARPGTSAEIIFDLVLGAVYCFDVINIREGRSRHFYITCYTVFGLENLAFAVAWFFRPWLPDAVEVGLTPRPANTMDRKHIGVLPRWSLLLGVVGAFLLGIGMMLSYYIFAHPSRYAKMPFSTDTQAHPDEKIKNEEK